MATDIVRLWSFAPQRGHARPVEYFEHGTLYFRDFVAAPRYDTVFVVLPQAPQIDERLLIVEPAVRAFAVAVQRLPQVAAYWRRDTTPVGVAVVLPTDEDDQQAAVFAAELAMLDALPPGSVQVAVYFGERQLAPEYQPLP